MRIDCLLVALSFALSVPAKTHAKSGAEILGVYPEFEKCGALVLGFSELIQYHPKTLVDIVTALDDRIAIVGVVADESQHNQVLARLKESNAPTKNLDLVQVPAVGMWIRDYGPVFVRRQDGSFIVLDAEYIRMDHRADDWIPRYLAGYFKLPVIDIPLRLNGGNLLSNGEGWVFTTSQVISSNAKRGFDQMEVAQILSRYYGATDWMVFKPLSGEPTGHLDMFMTLVAPNIAVVGEFDPADDPDNARQLDAVAAQLAQAQTRSGSMKVVRIPMPSHEDGKWRSYTNVILANGTLLVPIYPDASLELDEQALKIYSELLPDRRIVPIDATTLIEKNGSLHCISINVPEWGTINVE